MTTKTNIPQHIAFIMDGNRRWAKKKNLPSLKGHQVGYERMIDIGKLCLKRGVKYITVYAFSTENWNRSKREVDYLMRLIKRVLVKEIDQFHKEGLKILVIGEKKKLSKDVLAAVKAAMEKTQNNTGGVFTIALNYGGRQEIVGAVKKFLHDTTRPLELTVRKLEKYMYTSTLPDPDLVIRTSGEQRISNFLLWQSAYSEFYFSKCYWPDFTEREFDKALSDYAERQRRFGY